jgi:hypothetical protein
MYFLTVVFRIGRILIVNTLPSIGVSLNRWGENTQNLKFQLSLQESLQI